MNTMEVIDKKGLFIWTRFLNSVINDYFSSKIIFQGILVLMLLQAIMSPQNFVPVTTAQSCQAQNLVVISSLHFGWERKEVSIEFELRWTVRQWNAPRRIFYILTAFWGAFYLHGLTISTAWIGNYIHYKVWYAKTHSFPNIHGAVLEVWEWISSVIPNFTGHVSTYSCCDLS